MARKRNSKKLVTNKTTKDDKSKTNKFGKRSIKAICKEPIRNLKEHSTKPGKNSDYRGARIDLKDVREWDDFFTAADVEKLWTESPKLNQAVTRDLKQRETDRIIIGTPVRGGMFNEQCLVTSWDDVLKTLNLSFLKCAEALGKTGHIMIGDGQNAEWISPDAEADAHRKRPDYSGFLKEYDDDSQFLGDGPQKVFNRIPGDAKQQRKIRRDHFPPNGKLYKPKRRNLEAEKVLSQIHGYMDSHEARYGYIVTNEELICFRRRAGKWGQLDISKAIPHNVEANS